MNQDFETNPYHATRVGPRLDDFPDHLRDTGLDFVPVLRRWEKFRVAYNLVLVAYVTLLSLVVAPYLLVTPSFWVQNCVAGLIVNLCFFTGPAIEAYLRFFRVWHLVLSWALFFAGLVFTGVLATVSIVARM